MNDLVEVTKKKFYNYVNPRDITVHCTKTRWATDNEDTAECEWKQRSGYLVGKTITYYEPVGIIKYYLKKELT